MARRRRLGEWFYRRGASKVARDLLGRHLVTVDGAGRRRAGRIVETEAYVGVQDAASHGYGGRRTDRNEAMYARGGTAYVYFTYGMHCCFNVVTGRAEVPAACLVRALEPVEGVAAMYDQRAGSIDRARLRITDLCSGPAKLCQAMGIDLAMDGEPLLDSDRLFIEAGRPVSPSQIRRSPRIGIDYAGDWVLRELRFFVNENPHVSRR